MSLNAAQSSPEKKPSSEEEPVNIELCIICQHDDKASLKQLTTKPRGRASVKRAAEIRDDIVTKRLCTISAISGGVGSGTSTDLSETFKYHNNNKC